MELPFQPTTPGLSIIGCRMMASGNYSHGYAHNTWPFNHWLQESDGVTEAQELEDPQHLAFQSLVAGRRVMAYAAVVFAHNTWPFNHWLQGF